MPIVVNGKKYYKMSEAARIAGISRSTLVRWIKGGTTKDAPHRDRRGWRLFTETDIKALEQEAGKMK
jgi:DNA-binding transcriptional MerR regulator